MNKEEANFRQGQAVCHPKYDKGVVLVGGTNNIAVKFDNGGPVGFASNATNNIKDLQILS